MIGFGTPPDIGLGTPEGVMPALPTAADDDDDNVVPPVSAAESDGRNSISFEELPAKGLATRPVEGNWCCSIIILRQPQESVTSKFNRSTALSTSNFIV
mmetsp:Transcript_20274/g.33373  ORF Transcript_20274/g.33373 Transcript_20274/m.33373 type:complete len:99 (-) Transcript_20274:38-334(-)